MNLSWSQRCKDCLIGMVLTHNVGKLHKLTVLHTSVSGNTQLVNMESKKKKTFSHWRWTGTLEPRTWSWDQPLVTKLGYDQNEQHLFTIQIYLQGPLFPPCDPASAGPTACGPCARAGPPSYLPAAALSQEERQMLRECLLPLIQTLHSKLAGKIKGMLLETGNSELLSMLWSLHLSAPGMKLWWFCRLAWQERVCLESGFCCCHYHRQGEPSSKAK